jgi:hypothetical protein
MKRISIKFPSLKKGGTIMVMRKTNAIAFLCIFTAGLLVFVPQVQAQTTDEQKQALIGEWTGVWPGVIPAIATLVIHEIDAANGKARCTYTTAQRGEKQFPVLADFFPGPNPKLEFKLEGEEYTFFLKKNILEGAFKGMDAYGKFVSSTTKMEKKPKK